MHATLLILPRGPQAGYKNIWQYKDSEYTNIQE